MKNFYTIEGPEGSGKSTVIFGLKDYIEKEEGKKVLVTREPGGVETAEKVRELLLSDIGEKFDIFSLLLMYSTARKEHLEKVVKPFLATGGVVLCDRFVDSTFVYQGYIGGIPLNTIFDLSQLVVGEYMPDKTFLIDLPTEECLKRLVFRTDEANWYDKQGIDFHKKVREGYDALFKSTYNKDGRIQKIDGFGTREEVLLRMIAQYKKYNC